MPQWLTTTLSSFLASLFLAACTAFITVRLSLRRFHAERWWERKAEAYSRIVEVLYQAMEYCASHLHEEASGKELSEDRDRELSEGYVRSYRELRKVAAVGAYMISDEAARTLASLLNRPRLDPKHCAWVEVFDDDFKAYKEALEKIRALAKNDLKV